MISIELFTGAGGLFWRKLQPKIFLFENVRRLLSHDGGKTFQTMQKVFEDCGYKIQKKIAWDFGNAQKRERLITIGVRRNLSDKVEINFPTPHEYKPVLRDVF